MKRPSAGASEFGLLTVRVATVVWVPLALEVTTKCTVTEFWPLETGCCWTPPTTLPSWAHRYSMVPSLPLVWIVPLTVTCWSHVAGGRSTFTVAALTLSGLDFPVTTPTMTPITTTPASATSPAYSQVLDRCRAWRVGTCQVGAV